MFRQMTDIGHSCCWLRHRMMMIPQQERKIRRMNIYKNKQYCSFQQHNNTFVISLFIILLLSKFFTLPLFLD
jgi:hypothetical protein